MKGSGFKVNQSKTEACLFFKCDCAPVDLWVGDVKMKTKSTMNVLGVIFDTKLQWSSHVTKTRQKANGSLNALKKDYSQIFYHQ